MDVETLAVKAEISKTAVKRLIHEEVGGDLAVNTLFRVSLVLGIDFDIQLYMTTRGEDKNDFDVFCFFGSDKFSL